MPSPFEGFDFSKFNFGDSILNEPEFGEGLFGERVGQMPSQNQRDYFKGQFSTFANKYMLQLGQMLDANQDTSQFGFRQFLGQQPFGQQFAGLPPEIAGRLTGRFAPYTRFLGG